MFTKQDLIKLNDYLWEIPRNYRSDMRVPARVYATEKMLDDILGDRSLEQLINVTTLPGIQKYALAMPDIHEGYGFPIGGVAAFDKEEGIISPGGIGYDINCGVRLLRSKLEIGDIKNRLSDLGQEIYRQVPSGVGKGGRLNLKGGDFDRVLENGAPEVVRMGYGKEEDLKHLESGGEIAEADAELVSHRAKARGADQLGTMGAGNHFVEVEAVEKIFDEEEAARLGLFKDQAVVLIHTGSRGLGHQVATDYIQTMVRALSKYNISLPDRELACAPFSSPEGQNYFRAMSAGANFAWANRQLITWEVREAWKNVFGVAGGDLEIVYDVAHNIAKIENDLVVHRKGATRSFFGQPVLIPGSMGTGSYLLVGQEGAIEQSFGSSCHGAGRRMSRSKAKRMIRGDELKDQLEAKGITVASGSMSGLAEEAPEAYKNVDEVVEVVHRAGIAKKVARFRPVAVVKG
ncbi:MAG: RtcB family protein [Candidatus Colwellbacteria bacterium]|nr:RtcB family protein [Candidatus Colwellbacteria bacterium]